MTQSHAGPAARHEDTAPGTTAGDILIEWARRTPYRIALTEAASRGGPGRHWTCEALRDDAATLAVALLSRFAPGERIAVWAPPCPEGVLLQFAAAFAGLTLAMIDPACDVGELPRILDHSGAVGLFMMTGKGGRASARRAASRAVALREVVDLAEPWALFAKRRCVDGLPDVRPGDSAQIRYAVGGSGPPRGETVRHSDLADALLGAISSGRPRGDALLPYFPNGPQLDLATAVQGGSTRVGRVAAVA